MSARGKARGWFRRKSTDSTSLASLLAGAGSGTPQVRDAKQAAALPAALAAIRVLSESAAMLPVHVFRDGPTGVRERADDTPLARILRRRPAPDLTPVDWRSDAMASCVGFGNFYARKLRGGGRVRYLVPMDPRTVTPAWENGRIIYTVADGGGQTEKLGRRDVFHVRGLTLHGEAAGMSPITACRRALSGGVALEDYLARFLANGANPGSILEFPGTVTEERAEEIVAVWNATHRGAENAGKTALLGGGASWKQAGMSMQDAQFVEAQRFGVEQIARIFGVPASFLGAGAVSDADHRWFVTFALGPWLARFDSALSADDDLCPEADGLFVEHLADALLRPATAERYRAYKDARQGGWVTANELRRLENMPPIDGGDTIQETPVGGARNAQPGETGGEG